MTSPMVTRATGTSLQRLAEESWDRVAVGSVLHYEGTLWTGAQLAERVRRVSGGLRSAGLQPGERVVVCMANCPEVGITYQAVWRAGGVATPVLFLLSEDELRSVLADSGAVYAVTTPEFLPKVVAAASGLREVRGIIVCGELPADAGIGPALLRYKQLETGPAAELVDADPTGLAALLYTGGTTGRAKGVMISHDALSSAAWAATATSYDGARRTLLLPLPLSHVYGLMVSVMSLHSPAPWTSVLMRWFDAGLAAARRGAPGQCQPAGSVDAADAAAAAAGGL